MLYREYRDLSKTLCPFSALLIARDGAAGPRTGFLPGERLPQVVAVKNAEDQSLLYLRAKVFVYTSQNQMLEVDVVENSNWGKNEDGYFYYNDLIKPNEKVNFCSHIIVGGENFQPVSWKKYILSFVFETLDSTLDSQTIWGWQLVQND